MLSIELPSASAAATQAVGRAVGERCRGGEVLLLDGPLGAGKTCFAQGLAVGLDVPARYAVSSPTFVLHAQYPGRLLFNHIDAYRLADGQAVPELMFEELFDDTTAVAAVEWSTHLAALLPPEHLCVSFTVTDASHRLLHLAATSSHAHLLPAAADLGPSTAPGKLVTFPLPPGEVP